MRMSLFSNLATMQQSTPESEPRKPAENPAEQEAKEVMEEADALLARLAEEMKSEEPPLDVMPSEIVKVGDEQEPPLTPEKIASLTRRVPYETLA